MQTLIVGKSQLAKHLGMTTAGLLRREELPEPDFVSTDGKPIWFPENAEFWNGVYQAANPPGPKRKSS